MNIVFFGGSRVITRLDDAVCQRIDAVIAKRFLIVVGDATGADKAMQSFLAKTGYRDVQVFYTQGVCRNNMGNWPTIAVPAPRGSAGFAFYACKDLEMSRRASHGFMLWDGKSKGTLNNVRNLLEQGKTTLIFFAPDERFVTIRSTADIERLLSRRGMAAKQPLVPLAPMNPAT